MSKTLDLVPQKLRKAQKGIAKKKSDIVVGTIVFLSPRQRFLQTFCAKHKVTVPPVEVMFADQMAHN